MPRCKSRWRANGPNVRQYVVYDEAAECSRLNCMHRNVATLQIDGYQPQVIEDGRMAAACYELFVGGTQGIRGTKETAGSSIFKGVI